MSGQPRSTRGRASGRSQRQLRIGEELRHALARILGRASLDDPALADSNFTVTEVRLSPDLKVATAFVVPLGGSDVNDDVAGSVAALNRAAGFFRGQLAREVTLRHCPRIAFAVDRSFDQAGHIQAILERPRVRQDLGPVTRDDDDEDRDNGA